MNERIKELWDQAAKSTAAFPSGQNNSWETQVNFMEKFANLIVQECAMLVEGFTIEQEVALDDYQEYEASAVLKEHFGVEE